MVVRESKVTVSVGSIREIATKEMIVLLSMIKAKRVPGNLLARTLETIKSHLRTTEAVAAVGTQKINAVLLLAGPKLDKSIGAPQALRPVERRSVNLVKCG